MPSWPPRERRPMRPRRRNKSQNDWARRTGEVAWERFDGGEACPHPLQSSGSETSVMETRPVGGAAHVGLRPAVEPLAAPPSGRCQALPLPPQSPQNPRPTVVLGSKGSAVEELQRRLQIAGLYKGIADGFYGSKTIESVKLLQSRLRLPIDGVVSDNTWKTLTGNPKSTLQCMNSPTTALFNSLRAAIVPVARVKVWWNTFIPMAKVDGPPGSECFTGDGRGFSN